MNGCSTYSTYIHKTYTPINTAANTGCLFLVICKIKNLKLVLLCSRMWQVVLTPFLTAVHECPQGDSGPEQREKWQPTCVDRLSVQPWLSCEIVNGILQRYVPVREQWEAPQKLPTTHCPHMQSQKMIPNEGDISLLLYNSSVEKREDNRSVQID